MRTSAGRIRLIAASTAARKFGEGFSEALESEDVDNPGSRIARDKDAARAKRNRIPMSLFFSPSHGIIKALSDRGPVTGPLLFLFGQFLDVQLPRMFGRAEAELVLNVGNSGQRGDALNQSLFHTFGRDITTDDQAAFGIL